MIKRFLTSLQRKLKIGRPMKDAGVRQTEARIASGKRPLTKKTPARAQPETLEFSPRNPGSVSDGGPGTNVSMRSRYIREETGTHETLKIVDDSVFDSDDDESQFDPYNTGQFDRANSWNRSPRK